MPMYRYICENCGYEKVVMHSMDESPKVICDKCGSVMKRSIGRVGVVFKSEGFYTTDSRKSSTNTNGSKPSSDKDKGESKSSETEKAKT